MIHKNCEGCASLKGVCSLYKIHRRDDNDFSLKGIIECPCVECIIKSMCTNYCEEWET
jgi:hypothetical protein